MYSLLLLTIQYEQHMNNKWLVSEWTRELFICFAYCLFLVIVSGIFLILNHSLNIANYFSNELFNGQSNELNLVRNIVKQYQSYYFTLPYLSSNSSNEIKVDKIVYLSSLIILVHPPIHSLVCLLLLTIVDIYCHRCHIYMYIYIINIFLETK